MAPTDQPRDGFTVSWQVRAEPPRMLLLQPDGPARVAIGRSADSDVMVDHRLRWAMHAGTRRVCWRMSPRSSQRIRLSPERRASLLASLQHHFEEEFDEPLSAFRAEGLVDFFIAHLGPPVYNQGVKDATGYLQEKLADIEGEIHEQDEGR